MKPVTGKPGSISRLQAAGPRSVMLVIAALVLAECVSAFEAGMIFLALPRFGEIFGAPPSTTAWAVTAYMLVAATAALVGGRLGDLYGRKQVLISVMLLSAVGSFVSVFGDSMGAIIVGRGVQGVAGAIMPLCYGLAREALPQAKIGLGVGFIGGAGLLAGAGGSLIAGYILDVSDWHLIFVVAAVLAFIASVAVAVWIPAASRAKRLPKFDLLGAALLTPGLSSVLFGITKGSAWGWTSAPVLGLILGGVAILAVWTLWELRQAIPLINLRVLAKPSVSLTMFATGALSLGPIGAAMIISPMILLSPSSLPVGLGLSATTMGALTAAGAIVGFGVGPLAGMFAGKWGGRPVLIIGVILFLAYSMIIYVGYDSVMMMVAALTVGAMATAFCYTAFPKLIMESVSADVTSETTGVMVTARQAFSAVGVAVASVILSSSTVPETAVPMPNAIRVCVIFFMVCSLLALVACFAVKRSGAADSAPGQWEGEHSRGAHAPSVKA
ncbi:MFS transporter [Rhodococcus sp. (in: high G+C Gram-positive bacteria)]|uniref:MFS transporter n=1 Tax=Rhodococcus sp. TaxID=1831 RepID=UPI00257E5247|nr:MFS transporter [Rhodococcus sp. (in: high G+C Gram-positive bacteria)]MBQ7803077.1 MFS transporter [Rhodococcus sp. (in: high G+C Gram-positive bacteria)]